VVKQLSAALIERCFQAELGTYRDYEKNERAHQARPNHRNGYGQKTLKSDAGEITIAIPRDQEGSYDPLLVKRGQTSLSGFTEKILWLYAHGLSTRDIQAQILDWYGVEVSPQLISNVTEAVMDEVRQWQNWPLAEVYPLLSMDCLQLKVRENQRVINKAVYLALAVTMEGHKELLGMWISENEGAQCWLAVCTHLRTHGMKDCSIACVDGLTGFPEAIKTKASRCSHQGAGWSGDGSRGLCAAYQARGVGSPATCFDTFIQERSPVISVGRSRLLPSLSALAC
jgi:putative transposase